MTDLEIQEQAEEFVEKINSELPNGVNPTAYMYGFKDCAKWMQEQDEWIDLPAKKLLPTGYYAIRISHNGFVDVKFEFIDNQIIPYYYATHYCPVTLPSPPKTKPNRNLTNK